MIIVSGSTSQSIDVQIVDDSGLPVTGLTNATFPTVKYSIAGANADATITLASLATTTTAYSSGGVVERGEGVYRLDLPNAALSSTGRLTIRGEATGKRLICPKITVIAMNVNDAVRAGLTALPNAAAAANGGLPTCDANNSVKANILPNGTGTATAGAASTITLQTALGANNYGIGCTIVITSGTGIGQQRVITAYVNSTKVATVDRAWDTTPDATSVYAIIGISVPALSTAAAVFNVASTVNANTTTLGNSAMSAITNGKAFYSSVSTTPASAGNWIPYQTTSSYNGEWTHINTTTNQLKWWDSSNSLWTISTTLGTRGTNYFTCATEAGTYSPGGSASGSPILVSKSLPFDPNFPNASFLSDGCINANVVKALGTAITCTTSGVIDVNASRLGGTSQTGRDIGASVLLSSGTGSGQISLSSGTVTVGTNNDKTAYSLSQSFPANFSSMSIDGSGKVLLQATQTGVTIPNVTTVGTLTTYTGNTPQTGDAFARLGVAGVGLTNIGDTRIANLDATVSSRLAPAGTLATVTNLTNLPTMPTDWLTALGLSSGALAEITAAIWTDLLTSNFSTVGSIGKLLKDNVDAKISEAGGAGTISVTVPPAVAVASLSPGYIGGNRGDTLAKDLPVLGNISSRTKLVWTAKLPSDVLSSSNTDSLAIIQVSESGGLLRLNGAAATDSTLATLVVTNATTGATTLTLKPGVTSVIPLEDLVWDCQYWVGSVISSPIYGTMSITPDVTQAIM